MECPFSFGCTLWLQAFSGTNTNYYSYYSVAFGILTRHRHFYSTNLIVAFRVSICEPEKKDKEQQANKQKKTGRNEPATMSSKHSQQIARNWTKLNIIRNSTRLREEKKMYEIKLIRFILVFTIYTWTSNCYLFIICTIFFLLWFLFVVWCLLHERRQLYQHSDLASLVRRLLSIWFHHSLVNFALVSFFLIKFCQWWLFVNVFFSLFKIHTYVVAMQQQKNHWTRKWLKPEPRSQYKHWTRKKRTSQ